MTPHEAIQRLCALKSRVGREHFNNQYMHDCFCGDNPFFVIAIDEEVIKFIEDAVEEKMKHEHN